MSNRNRFYRIQALVVLVALLLSPLQGLSSGVSAAPASPPAAPPTPAALPVGTGLYRAHIPLDGPEMAARLEKTGVRILAETEARATVLVDGDQLELLAKAGLLPAEVDEMGALVAANSPDRTWMTEGLRPLLARAAAVEAARQALDAGVAGATERVAVPGPDWPGGREPRRGAAIGPRRDAGRHA